MDSAVSRRLTSLKAANLSWTHLDHKGKIAPNFVPFESGEACQGVETAVDVQSGLCRQGRMSKICRASEHPFRMYILPSLITKHWHFFWPHRFFRLESSQDGGLWILTLASQRCKMNRSSYVYIIGHLLPAAVGWRFLLSDGSSLLPSLSRFLLVSGNENPISGTS